MEQLFRLPESTNRTQTHVITIPSLQSIQSIRVNTGSVTVVKVEGDKVTIQAQNGAYSRRVQTGGSYTPADTKWVTNQTSSNYNSGGYTGTLSQYVHSGSYTPAHSKTVTDTDLIFQPGNPKSTKSYLQDGYSGTLNLSHDPGPPSSTRMVEYTGTVTRPASDTRVYRYQGNVTRPESDTRTYTWYYQYDVTIDYIGNTAPVISGQDENLGDRNKGLTLNYTVNDANAEDVLIVTEKLNGNTLRTIDNAPRDQDIQINITDEMFYSLPLDSTNTIEIKVDDKKGATAYRRYTFRRTNTAPIISGEDEDLGQKTEPFNIDFSATDEEGDSITIKTYLNGIKKEEYAIETGEATTFTISKDDWFRLPIGQHSIKIVATDEHGATAVRNYTFTRFDDKIQFTLKAPIETDIMATKILIVPTWNIPQGAIATVEACNNAYDSEPTWEDITSQVLISRHYNFTNNEKTDENWGIDIRFTIEKGTATEECIIYGFGGAFE